MLIFSYVFWLGDLNFRLSNDSVNVESPEAIERLIRDGRHKQLLEFDQLKEVMESGDAFSELNENLPTFPPTFKFEVGTSTYDFKLVYFEFSKDRPPRGCIPSVVYKFSAIFLNFFIVSFLDEGQRGVIVFYTKPIKTIMKILRYI